MPSLRDKAHDGVLCTFSTRTSATAAGFARSSQLSSSSGKVRQGRRHGPSITYNSLHRSHIEAMNDKIPSAFRAPNLFCVTKYMTNSLISLEDKTSSNFYSIFCMAESYTPISLSSLADTVDTNPVGLSAWQNGFDCMTK
jgi:hypothetical protein